MLAQEPPMRHLAECPATAELTARRDRLRGGGETRTRKCRFTKRWAELLGFPEHFRTRDFFARTAKGLIGGAEPLLAQLRPAADCCRHLRRSRSSRFRV